MIHPGRLSGAEFQPHVLREYALIADGERGALIGPRGDVAWMCAPDWDGDALFASLIGGRGIYAVCPRGRYVWGGYYDRGSLIWNGRWVTEEGVAECREALALPAAGDRIVLLRRIVAPRGAARMRVVLDLRSDFGRSAPRRLVRDDMGRWIAELKGGLRALWSGAADAVVEEDGDGGTLLALDVDVAEGEHRDLVLVVSRSADGLEPPEPDRAWLGTEAAWRERVPRLDLAVGGRDAEHSYAVLSGLTSTGGGMVAAATTSLPERAGQGRSYDYRYVWIRDQCYAGQAIAAAGPHPLMDDAVRFVRERLLADGPHLMPAYTVRGGSVPDQRRLKLPGYPGGSDIVGNWVNKQFQLDAFGEALLLFAAAARDDHLDGEGWRAVEAATEVISARWQQPDAGIWEIEPRAWTHSRLTCVAGLRAVCRLPGAISHSAEWSGLADAILADTSRRALHPAGHWQRSDGDPGLDASLVLPGVRGALADDDPRTRATLLAVSNTLTEDGYCYRYRPDARPLGRSEGAFLLCGFMMALAYQQQGDLLSAARWFERNRAACGPPGLFSEEFDTQQRQLRGNLPQAFVHALQLECAVRQSATGEAAADTSTDRSASGWS